MTDFPFKLGKLPARPDAVKFKLAKYLDTSKLPPMPKTFGHETVVGSHAWQMLGNDKYGDCVWAGAGHETILWNLANGRQVSFTDQSVLSDYSAVTGFNPNDPNSDQGTDMGQAAAYRRKTGVVDAHGVRHKVAAYLSVEPQNLTQLYYATYLFDACGIGINFPGSAMDQFNAGKPWSVVKGATIEGGHYIPVVAKRTRLEIVTWAALQGMTTGFYDRYNDETIAYVSPEDISTGGRSPEGFDMAGLIADLAALTPAS